MARHSVFHQGEIVPGFDSALDPWDMSHEPPHRKITRFDRKGFRRIEFTQKVLKIQEKELLILLLQ